jgi:hypothetical protein
MNECMAPFRARPGSGDGYLSIDAGARRTIPGVLAARSTPRRVTRQRHDGLPLADWAPIAELTRSAG